MTPNEPDAAKALQDGQRELRDQPDPLPVVSSDVVLAGAIWDVRRDRFRYGDSIVTREYLDHPGAVAVLAWDEQDRVLLIQQYRHSLRSREWELPAGLLDQEHEDPLQAAQRELAEEVDLIAAEWSVLIDFFTSPGSTNESVRVYSASGIRPTPTSFVREHEESDIEIRWVTLDEAVAGVLAGRLRNSILSLAVLAAAQSRR